MEVSNNNLILWIQCKYKWSPSEEPFNFNKHQKKIHEAKQNCIIWRMKKQTIDSTLKASFLTIKYNEFNNMVFFNTNSKPNNSYFSMFHWNELSVSFYISYSNNSSGDIYSLWRHQLWRQRLALASVQERRVLRCSGLRMWRTWNKYEELENV